MISRISKYINILLLKAPVICAEILDIRIKMKFFMTFDSALDHFGTLYQKLQLIFVDEAKNHFKYKTASQDNQMIEKGTALFYELYPSHSQETCTLETEPKRFLAEPPEPKDTDILLFWKSQGNIFPTLSLMAQKFLATPATSAPFKHVFLGGRKILTCQCSLLSPNHVNNWHA
ncbi:hypothetical protein O181_001065 [Austropuccinia psidii MF-1]|uniref:HAT C-terminal dimerisation domain-containing protein n=1 Tax=Austropuccinia psidii MF-1 TaxID=1389203 RepID=A0A9Q3GBG5_9BASI|nr:hypothetical protein [Austropuccinia psidii MF-1]